MKLLGIDASSTRGSVALVEATETGAKVIATAFHEEPNRHAERLMGLVKEVFDEAPWGREELERIAVGVGPGSFTGIRVALALAQGLMVGLGIEGVGVASLGALASSVPAAERRTRVVVRDARREEFFVAAYSADGETLVEPYATAQQGAVEHLKERFGQDFVVVGTALPGVCNVEGEFGQEPDARAVARVGARLSPASHPVAPQYVRGPNITRPKLPVSPLELPRS